MKEWLCLNCQTQRASGPPNPTQPKPIKAPAPASPQSSLQNFSPQQGSKGDTSTKPDFFQTDTSKDKSGFGLSHDKSQASSTQPAASAVSEKVLGFGSSIISSASNLISSAVQDEASVTPPSSRKSSAASEASVKTSTPPTSRKVPVVSEKDLPSKEPNSVTQHLRPGEKISEHQTTKKQQSAEVKVGSLSACLLCKEKFQNNPPNFNTCTSCKMTVCNLCGFNPTPDQTEVGPCQSSTYLCVIVHLYIKITEAQASALQKQKLHYDCKTKCNRH